MKTAIVTSNTFLDHNTGNGHPERPDRVSYVIKKLKEEKNLIWDDSKKFDEKLLNITHTAKYISDVKKIFPDNGLNGIRKEMV